MAKSARSGTTPPPAAPRPHVESGPLQKRLQLQDVSDVPVRTIITVEVGDMMIKDVQEALTRISQIYGAGKHPTYVIPVRHGRMTSTIVFESGILEMVRSLCTVDNDGEIVMRDGWRDVDVMTFSL